MQPMTALECFSTGKRKRLRVILSFPNFLGNPSSSSAPNILKRQIKTPPRCPQTELPRFLPDVLPADSAVKRFPRARPVRCPAGRPRGPARRRLPQQSGRAPGGGAKPPAAALRPPRAPHRDPAAVGTPANAPRVGGEKAFFVVFLTKSCLNIFNSASAEPAGSA